MEIIKTQQDLSKFKIPENFRGKPTWYVQLWWLVQSTIFKNSPQFAYKFRAQILRCFGAEIGKNTIIRPTATFTYPWKIKIGDYAWIGDDVVLYSLGNITIGNHSVISQRSYICAGDHDYRKIEFPIRGPQISIGSQCWIATDTFVAPGVSIGNNTVVGARSSVFKNLPSGFVCTGSPCKPIKPR
jgi:putative colanic acid biosynthesis acetyltransferase WcaF